MLAVTLAAALAGSSRLGAQVLSQYGRKPAADKGPRALGLIEIPQAGSGATSAGKPGKARLIPIAIMLDGKFYDAGSYKAAPVPMALDFGIVYEGFRSGVSQGVFKITQPGQLNHEWLAEGTWYPTGSAGPETHKKYAKPVIVEDDPGGPPVLHRRGEKTDSGGGATSAPASPGKDANNGQPKTASSPTTTAAPPGNAPNPAGNSAGNSADNGKAPAAGDSAKTTAPPGESKASAPASSPAEDEPIGDPNRPRLRRGKPDAAAHSEPYATFEALPGAASGISSGSGPTGVAAKPEAKAGVATTPAIVIMPAISDAGGPDPRPYTYDVKPAEEAMYRTKMLDLAASEVRAQSDAAKEAGGAGKKTSGAKAKGKSAVKVSAPSFDDVSLRVFDLSNSNEPVLVLSAKLNPPAAVAAGSIPEPKEIMLIARTNLEGEMQKLFFSQTDSGHRDVVPGMELIDAVDADGDGRGELLFRRIFDGGSAYAIYRVTADGLWPLFEGTP